MAPLLDPIYSAAAAVTLAASLLRGWGHSVPKPHMLGTMAASSAWRLASPDFKKGRGVSKDQKSMPPPDIAGADASLRGTSATMASVVMSKPATDAAPCSAQRTTLVGSMMPFVTRLPYSPL
jgi:hypothetical protein